ncbi:MAG: T9SS type A sorting domain-containing protein [Crocinitomicaceae bacterium]|jgi:hypothetical protein|nr:T9SS type A sorting domain-containing protein [Crocinitomicaceae bacterium]
MKKRNYSSGYHAFKSYQRYLRKKARLTSAGFSSGDKLNFLNKRIEKLKLFLSTILKKSKVATAAASVILTLNSGSANGQTFISPVTNPYGLNSTSSYRSAPAFADLDNDGDLDMIAGDSYYGNFLFYENTGSSTAPAFAASQNNPFGLSNLGYYSFNTPTFGDLDGDGDFDMMVGSDLGSGVSGDYSSGNIYYFENIGDAANPNFAAPVENAFGITIPSYTYVGYYGTYIIGEADQSDPALVDIDGDGDLDMYVGNGSGGDIYYYENTGTASAPAFDTPIVALSISSDSITPDFADFDGDGDFDLFGGDDYGDVYYSENTGTNLAPVFAAAIQNPFTDLQSVGYSSNVALADLDDDGDWDIMVGASSSNFYYFEQCTAPVAPVDNTPVGDLTICNGESTTLTVTGVGTLGWYDASTGGNYIGGGTSFLTGILTADATFYVQDSTCVDGPRIAIDVTVNPIPNVATTLTGNTISADLVGATYQWVTCPTYLNASGSATGQSYTPSTNGQYAVIVSNLGCSDTSACTTISTVGMEQNNISNLAVYPNPTDGNFTLDLGKNYDQITIQITNSLGQVVENSVYSEFQLIDIQLEAESGIYFVEIITNEGLRSKVKLVIK